MSFPIDVEDDGSPRAALDLAGQGVRAFNHRSGQRFHPYRDGWNHVPDVYRCLGELYYLAGLLPQAVQHMSDSMNAALEAGHVGADPGSEYDGRPEVAIAAALAALEQAPGAARTLYDALSAAQNAISRIHYAGPGLEGDDGED